MKTTLTIATVLILAEAPVIGQPLPQPLLMSLPAEVQKQIEDVRVACRAHLVANGEDPDQSWTSSTANGVARVSSGDEGLETFTVSGSQAVMVNDLDLCGGQCLRGTNCSNRGSYRVAIYLRSGKVWREALSTTATGSVFLSTDWMKNDTFKFKALVLNVFGGNKDCPTHDIPLGKEGKERLFFPAWKQSCAAVVKWNGTKFTYKPL